MACCCIVLVVVAEYVSPVNLSVVLSELIPLFLSVHFLEVRILLEIRIPSYEELVLVELDAAVAAIDEIRQLT